MYTNSIGLIPAFSSNTSAGNARISDINTGDITLDTFLKTFLKPVPYWVWSNSTQEDVRAFIRHALMSFCNDHEKVTSTQNMIKAFMYENLFRDFILHGTQKFEEYRTGPHMEKDFTYKMSLCFESFVTTLSEEFGKISEPAQQILKPFIDHLNTLRTAEPFTQLQEFNRLFIKPMKFVGYLGKHPGFVDDTQDLIKGKFYSDDSQTLYKAHESSVLIHDTSCTIAAGDKEVATNSLSVLDMKDAWYDKKLSFFTYKTLSKVLGISLEQLLFDLMPTSDNPMKVTVTIEPGKGGYNMSLLLEDVAEGYKLTETGDWAKRPKTLVLHKNDLYDILPQKPQQRTEFQKQFLGKVYKFSVEDKDGFSSPAYTMKVKFFYAPFFRKMQLQTDEFGKFVLELRYLAFIAEQFRIIGRITPVTFPKLVPKEENLTEIIEARNPVLIIEPGTVPDRIVPNKVSINSSSRIQVITGPNQNGKTKYIDSIALNQIFCQAGWPIFAKQATMSPKTDLRIHYVHSGVGVKGESRFSHECQRMRKAFKETYGAYPLFIVDEPYTGTNYNDEQQLLEEMLTACAEEDITILLTTHCHGLIPFVEQLPKGKNLHCYVDENGNFTYQIREGSSTKSNALRVAETAGVRLEQLRELIQHNKKLAQQTEGSSVEEGATGDDDLPF